MIKFDLRFFSDGQDFSSLNWEPATHRILSYTETRGVLVRDWIKRGNSRHLIPKSVLIEATSRNILFPSFKKEYLMQRLKIPIFLKH